MGDLLYPDGHLWLAEASGNAIAARVTMVRRTISAKHNKGRTCVTLVSKDRPSLQIKTRVTLVSNFNLKTAVQSICVKAAGKLKIPSIIPDTGQANNWHLGRTDPCSNSYWCVVDAV